jgi:hypothetical protein
MLNLLKLKQEKAAAKEGGAGEEGGKAGGKVIPAAQRRVQKDLKTGIEKNSWCVGEVGEDKAAGPSLLLIRCSRCVQYCRKQLQHSS